MRQKIKYIILLFLLPLSIFAGRGKILFVETDIDLRADGEAVVACLKSAEINAFK